MSAYATTVDLANRWRPLTTGAETTRAETLLDAASRFIREKAPTLDDRIADDEFDPDTATDIVCDMVARRMEGGPGGVQSRQVTVGSVSTSMRFTGPSGLYLTAAELHRLTPTVRGAFSVSIATPDPV